ncbi:MAG TPA: 4-(cytidine 5'-diphospho)-2-C-methyl-D-erythritol kinase [Dehalococcoidales bacterium]|nr:4-(cytidine 5'-diphospho)-2-C-methyl-D-erythritol kinase [Dehalococcoidales bacterium]
MLTLLAPAKLNLTLEVVGKRDDGYHEIRSVVQTIGLCDRLLFQASRQTEYSSNMPEWLPEQSLVPRAVDLVREATGCNLGVEIQVEKYIPLMSGLGGDSSDAAAVLRGLNGLWELNLSQEKLRELASRLGSDVALFLYGGTVMIEGRGEKVTPLPSLSTMWVVLVLPEVPREPGKTGRAYANLQEADYTDGRATERLVETLKTGRDFAPSRLFNTFERSAYTSSSELVACRERMLAAGADNVHLTGSGPALFTLIKDRTEAEGLHDRLSRPGMEVYLAEMLATGEWLN